MIDDYYIHQLSQHELHDSRHDVEHLVSVYGLDDPDFERAMLARQKAWANLIAQDWDLAIHLKPSLLDYDSQDAAHEAAVMGVVMRQNRITKALRRENSAQYKKSKKKAKET